MLKWMGEHETLMWTAGASSLLIIVGSLFAIPAVVVRIRPDYFTHRKRPPGRWERSGPAIRTLVLVVKNVLGVLLMLAGIAMFVLPGQGLLTLAVGFFLLDFPGKYRMEKWLISRRSVRGPINWLRKRRGREPLAT